MKICRSSIVSLAALVALLLCLTGIVGPGSLARPLQQGGAPTVVSYQGQVRIAGQPYSGTGYFKFAIVDQAGTTAFWSNADTSGGGEPAGAVALPVSSGLFSVLLGDTSLGGMAQALGPAVFSAPERYLRVWFSSSAAGPFQRLEPDRRIAAVPYALQAEEARNAGTLGGLYAGAFWQLGGNAGTTGSSFLGTTDGQALELRVGNARALRLEPNATSPNIIGGYSGNSVTAGMYGATIGGGGASGLANSVTSPYGTVGGGAGNRAGLAAGQPFATVAGGYGNTASDYGATVGGGRGNTAWWHATVPGGLGNEARGAYSFAAGGRAQAVHTGSFVWSDWGDPDDPNGTPFSSARANHFAVRARGGVYFATKGDLTSGVQLAPGGSSWSSFSDRSLKENLAPVDQQALLARLAGIPISTWNYKAQDPSIRHIGPMAQDFNALLPDLGGEGEKYINSLDADGVALAAIQGLHQRSQDQAARIEQLEAENATLRGQLASIEGRLSALENGNRDSSSTALPTGWLALLVGGLVAGGVVLKQGR